jgi:hypothetical protein
MADGSQEADKHMVESELSAADTRSELEADYGLTVMGKVTVTPLQSYITSYFLE